MYQMDLPCNLRQIFQNGLLNCRSKLKWLAEAHFVEFSTFLDQNNQQEHHFLYSLIFSQQKVYQDE